MHETAHESRYETNLAALIWKIDKTCERDKSYRLYQKRNCVSI